MSFYYQLAKFINKLGFFKLLFITENIESNLLPQPFTNKNVFIQARKTTNEASLKYKTKEI